MHTVCGSIDAVLYFSSMTLATGLGSGNCRALKFGCCVCVRRWFVVGASARCYFLFWPAATRGGRREGSVEAIIGTAAAAASQRATGMEWDESPRCKAKGCCIWRPLPTNDGAWMCSRLRVKQKQVTGDVDARCLRRPGEVLLSGNGATQASEFLLGRRGP